MLSPSERSLRARIGALSLHATYDPHETTLKARQAIAARFERPVDADGAAAEALRRAEYARRAQVARLALAAARQRSSTSEGAAA